MYSMYVSIVLYVPANSLELPSLHYVLLPIYMYIKNGVVLAQSGMEWTFSFLGTTKRKPKKLSHLLPREGKIQALSLRIKETVLQ